MIRRELLQLYVCTKFQADSSFRLKVIRRVPKFRNWVTWPRQRPLRGRYIFRTLEGSVLHLCTKFEADCSIYTKVIKGRPKFGNWVAWPRPRPLGDRFIFLTLEQSDVHLCTKFEADRSIRSKVIRGPKNLKLGHVTQATPT